MIDDEDNPRLTVRDFKRMMLRTTRQRLMRGDIRPGDDVGAIRRFVGMTQVEFARALRVSVHTLRNWEQGRRRLDGPVVALLTLVIRHPNLVRRQLTAAVAAN